MAESVEDQREERESFSVPDEPHYMSHQQIVVVHFGLMAGV